MQAGCYDFAVFPKIQKRQDVPLSLDGHTKRRKISMRCNGPYNTGQWRSWQGSLKSNHKGSRSEKIHYTDENILTDPNLGFQMEIPSGWRIYTLRADNVLFGRSLSSVHTDSMMIRRLSDDSFKELGSATKATINEAEKNFIEKSQAIHPILQSFIMNPSLSVTFAEVFRSRPIMKT